MNSKEALQKITEEVGSGTGFEGYEIGEIIRNITKEVKDPICSGCVWWRQINFKGRSGKCELSRKKSDKMFSGCGLITDKTFSCSEFKPFTPKENE
jgi:hypothetical protein